MLGKSFNQSCVCDTFNFILFMISPLYGDASDKYPQYNTDYALKLLIKLGADKEKLIVGVPFYGQTFMLSSSKAKQGFNSASDGPGEPGEVTNQPGMLAYNEICNRLRRPGWHKGTDPTGKSGPYATNNDQWVGYDDVEMIAIKTKYVINAGYGGVAAWTVDLDDFSNRCCFEPFPLLRSVNRALGRLNTRTPTGSDCTRPPLPVTPVPPLMVATVDTGAAGIPGQSTILSDPMQSTTTSWWSSPTTTRRTTAPSTSSPWWTPSSVTTKKTTTTEATTSSPWWTPSSTSKKTSRKTTTRTTEPSTTTTKWSTTRRSTTTERTTTSSAFLDEDNSIPVPVNIQPVVITGPCNEGEYRAHPSKCNEYLVCSNGLLLTQYCSSNLHWNDRNKNCDWPDNAKCTTGSEPPADQEPSTTKRPLNTRRTTVATPPTTPASTKAPTSRKTTTPRPVTTTRAPETTRKSTTRRTTTVEVTDYTEPPTTTRPRSTTKRIETVRPTYYETTTAYMTTTSKKPIKRTGCVNGEYYAHKDCRKYYICNNGKRVPVQCPEGTQFSQKLTTCDFEENVKCVSKKKYLKLLKKQYRNSGIFTSSLLRASEGDPCEGYQLLSYPGLCANYLECNQETMSVRDCPPGLYFDPAINNCNWPNNVDCKNDPDLETNEIDGEDGGDDDEEPEKETSGGSAQVPEFAFDQGVFKPSTTTTKRPSTSINSISMFETIPVLDKVQPLSGAYKLVCYFTNWAWYRPGIGKYLPDNIDENLCTHVVYGFAVLNYDELTIKTHDSWADIDNKFYERVVELKNKGVVVTLAIGGWNDSAGDKYSRLVRNAAARAKFIKHVIEFLEKYGFEGLDLDWEYPGCPQVDCAKGHPDEKKEFANFVKEISEAFKPRGLLLSSAVSPSKTVIDAGYDVPKLSQYFDWIAVMCYDYHGQWDKKTGHVAPLYHHPDDEVDFFNTVSICFW